MSILPHAESSGAFDCDSLFAFQIHRVHFGPNAVFAADIVDGRDATGVIQDAFSEGGFAAVNVGRYANVASLDGVNKIVGGGGEGAAVVVVNMSMSIKRMH